MVMLLLWRQVDCLGYTLSDDKTIFTAKGYQEPLTQACVRDSKLYPLYMRAIISNGITEISSSAFAECSALKSISIASTVHTIGDLAFYKCSSLLSVEFPTGVVEVGISIFNFCTSLASVTFSPTMTSLGKTPFKYTSRVSKIEVRFNQFFETDAEGKFLINNKTVLACCVTNCEKIIVPSYIETISDNCFESLIYIKSIEFDEGSKLATVGSASFVETQITIINLPFGTRWLGYSLFDRSLIKTIILPSTLEYVASSVFDRATQLTNVTIVGDCPVLSSENGVIYDKNKVVCLFIPADIEEMYIGENTTSFSISALQTKTHLVKVNVSKNNKKFLDFNNTLYDKSSLSLLAVLGGAKYIEVHENCTSFGLLSAAHSNIEKIVFLGTKVTFFGRNAFSLASKLKILELPYGLMHIYSWCLDFVPNIKKLVFPSTFLTIAENAMTASGITEVDFSACSEMRYLGSNSFRLSNIITIRLPPFLIDIQSESFSSTSSLITIRIPSSVTHIHSKAFEGSALQSITFENSSNLTYLAEYCFTGTNLVEFTFPSNVEEAGESIFSGCTKLEKISFDPNSKLRILTPMMFSGCKITDIFLDCPQLSTIMECTFTGCSTLKSIEICSENNYFIGIEACLYTKDTFELVVCPCGAEEVIVDENTTAISRSAFFECNHLKRVNFRGAVPA